MKNKKFKKIIDKIIIDSRRFYQTKRGDYRDRENNKNNNNRKNN